MPDHDSNEPWERQALKSLATSTLQEQKCARRWGIFFKSLTFIYLFALLFLAIGWFGKKDGALPGKHTALVDLIGVIAPDSNASAEHVTVGLRRAFKDKNTRGVILRINSPGGSPVQAGYINDEIHRLRALYPKTPIYAVVEDICASGGYYVAAAADTIYVNKASIIGSIGVLMNGFGFTGAMGKLGVERRLLTTGANKGFLDPFSPLDATQKKHAQKMLGDIHQQFISAVRSGRGQRLKENADTFSGLMWTGEKSIELGLADATGNIYSVARDVIKAKDIVNFTPKKNFAERFVKRLGVGVAQAMTNQSLPLFR